MERKDENVYPGAIGENISHISANPDNSPGGSGTVSNPPVDDGTGTSRPGDDGSAGTPGGGGYRDQNILELVYGVLFEPARTFAGFVLRPPVLAALVAVVLLNLAEALMGLFTTPQYLRDLHLPSIPELRALRSLLPLAAAGGFFISLVKWFVMAGLLHLLAELYGGRGSAKAVFAVYGLAGLPAAFMIPVQLLANIFQSSTAISIITGLFSLAVFIWSVVLLVIGIREVHRFSTGRAALTVFTPAMVLVLLLIIALIMAGSIINTLPGRMMYM